jgi:hypothetical protein
MSRMISYWPVSEAAKKTVDLNNILTDKISYMLCAVFAFKFMLDFDKIYIKLWYPNALF